MRKLTLSLAIVLVLAATVPVVDAAAPATARVDVGDDYFDPAPVRIRKGGKVIWRWVGDDPHNVALKKPGSNKVVKRSSLKMSGRFSYTFRTAGRWRAVCEVHPDDMTMRVRVVAPR